MSHNFNSPISKFLSSVDRWINPRDKNGKVRPKKKKSSYLAKQFSSFHKKTQKAFDKAEPYIRSGAQKVFGKNPQTHNTTNNWYKNRLQGPGYTDMSLKRQRTSYSQASTATTKTSKTSKSGIGSELAVYKGEKRRRLTNHRKPKKAVASLKHWLSSLFPILRWRRKGFNSTQINNTKSGFQSINGYYTSNVDELYPGTRASIDYQLSMWWTRLELSDIYQKLVSDVVNISAGTYDPNSSAPSSTTTATAGLAYNVNYTGLQCLGGWRSWRILNTGASILTIDSYIVDFKKNADTTTRGAVQAWATDMTYQTDIYRDVNAPRRALFQQFDETANTPGRRPEEKRNKLFHQWYRILQKDTIIIAPGQSQTINFKIEPIFISMETLKQQVAVSNDPTNVPDFIDFIKGITKQIFFVAKGQLCFEAGTADAETSTSAMGLSGTSYELSCSEDVKWRAGFYQKNYMEVTTEFEFTASNIDQPTLDNKLYPEITNPKIINPHGEAPTEFQGETDYD